MKLDRLPAEFPAFADRSEKLARTFAAVERRMQRAQETHLGHPYNLSFAPQVPEALHGYLINIQSDADGAAPSGSEVFEEEREAIAWLMRLWGCLDLERFWGAVCTSGSEGNLWGLCLGREMLPDAVLLHGADAHCSLPNAAHLLRLPARKVASLPDGAMDLTDLAAQLQGLAGRPVIVALTCGTAMTGAHDSISGALAALQAAGYARQTRFVHVDGALNAMVLPFLQNVPSDIQPSFERDIDSMSTSGHKMIATPMPCGALVARREHVARLAGNMGDLQPGEAAMLGSRNGHAVLAMWARFFGHGYGRFAFDALRCVERAKWLAAELAALGVPVLCNPFSLTVVFPVPDDAVVRRYHLACKAGRAHAIVMPSVTDDLLVEFFADYAAWWTNRPRMI